MWRQAKVTVGDKSADQALVNFADKTADKPEWLEWPERPELNAVIKVGNEKRYADAIEAIGGQFHVALMRNPIRPADPPQEEALGERIEGHEAAVKEAESALPKKGAKK